MHLRALLAKSDELLPQLPPTSHNEVSILVPHQATKQWQTPSDSTSPLIAQTPHCPQFAIIHKSLQIYHTCWLIEFNLPTCYKQHIYVVYIKFVLMFIMLN